MAMFQSAYQKIGCLTNRLCGWVASGRGKPLLDKDPQKKTPPDRQISGKKGEYMPPNTSHFHQVGPNSPTLEPVSRVYTVVAQWCKVTVMCAPNTSSGRPEMRHSWPGVVMDEPVTSVITQQATTPSHMAMSLQGIPETDIGLAGSPQRGMTASVQNIHEPKTECLIPSDAGSIRPMASPRTRLKQEAAASKQLDEYFYNLVLQLVDEGENVNYSDYAGYTPLMLACVNRNHQAIQLLIALSNNVNFRNQEGATALMLSSACDDVQSVKTLVGAGADLDIMDCHQQTALMECSVRGSPNMVRALVECGATTNLRDSRGRTALHLAILHGHFSVAHCLVNFGGCDINIKDEDGYSPLYLAAWDPGYPDQDDTSRLEKSVTLIHRLAEKGADMDCHDNHQVACLVRTWNRKSVVKALIANGALVNRTLKVGKNEYPLPIVAALEGDFDMVNLLWRAGYDSASLSSTAAWLLDDKHSTIISQLNSTFAQPLSLKDRCRLVIRQSCGHVKLKCKLAFLPLPPPLIDFLAFEP